MLRELLAVVGIVEILSPDELVAAAERVALDNPGECDLKPWVVPVARIEGVAYLFVAWRSAASYSAFKRFLGLIGLLALLYPERFTECSARIAYVDEDRCEWKPWVYPLTRLVGLLYVLVAVREIRKS